MVRSLARIPVREIPSTAKGIPCTAARMQCTWEAMMPIHFLRRALPFSEDGGVDGVACWGWERLLLKCLLPMAHVSLGGFAVIVSC